jgi:subtilase family serine protease
MPVVLLALVAALGLPGTAASAAAPAHPTVAAAENSNSSASSQSIVVPSVPKGDTIHNACPPATPGHSQCYAQELLPAATGSRATVRPDDASPSDNGYAPSDLQSAYDLTSASASRGTGETVAVVDVYDDTTAESDLAFYRSTYHLPACTTANGCFTKVNEFGEQGDYPAPDPSDDDWSPEVSLDLDMVSAICPHCNIMLVEADSSDNGDLAASEDTAVGLGAEFVSNSYGGSEDTTDAADYDHPGVVITASTGDHGFAAGIETPAAYPGVVAVGGTSLLRDPDVSRGWAEITWADGQSGCSAYETKPAWQTDTGCTTKSLADVSADANPMTGVDTYNTYGTNGGWGVWGGTSEASPIIAATYALGGVILDDYAAQETYATVKADPGSVNDITEGTNYPEGAGSCNGEATYECNAGPGYDGPTGLGTPNGITAFEP